MGKTVSRDRVERQDLPAFLVWPEARAARAERERLEEPEAPARPDRQESQELLVLRASTASTDPPVLQDRQVPPEEPALLAAQAEREQRERPEPESPASAVPMEHPAWTEVLVLPEPPALLDLRVSPE